MTQQQTFVGLMSGTSLDGIDAVLAHFREGTVEIIKHTTIAYPASLQKEFIALFTPANNELTSLQKAAYQRTELVIKVLKELLSGIDRSSIVAIADHGQTIRHFPHDDPPYTLQVHQGARLAAATGINTVVDFRSKDIADGGQGAPLVPAFHQAFFADKQRHRIIVNIGGIANLSLLAPKYTGPSIGFDTGPGNTLLDAWCQQHTGVEYDEDGRWGESGNINDSCLTQLLDEDYFHLAAPKSTGREYFNLEWLKKKLKSNIDSYPANDVQASLCALTAQTINLGIQQVCEQSGINSENALEGVYVCGGGAYNKALMQKLENLISAPVKTSDALGVPPKLVEAAAFAWLGKMAIEWKTVDLRLTTGAKHSNILGAIYPA
jgi:anhydro-N-acetylmuramic acid kinase